MTTFSRVGEPFVLGQEPLLADGVNGVAFDQPNGIYISFIVAVRPGSGDVGRYLDALPKDRRIVVPNVLSNRLRGMLLRRGFAFGFEYDEQSASHVEIFERKPEGATDEES